MTIWGVSRCIPGLSQRLKWNMCIITIRRRIRNWIRLILICPTGRECWNGLKFGIWIRICLCVQRKCERLRIFGRKEIVSCGCWNGITGRRHSCGYSMIYSVSPSRRKFPLPSSVWWWNCLLSVLWKDMGKEIVFGKEIGTTTVLLRISRSAIPWLIKVLTLRKWRWISR